MQSLTFPRQIRQGAVAYNQSMSFPSPPQLPVGRALGDLVVEGLLGRGGAGAVYQVVDRRTEERQALKMVHSTHPELRARLQREADLQASVRHRHVLRVLGVIDIHGHPGVRMELVEGPSLEHWLAHRRPDLAEALAIFRAVALGVGAAHSRGLVHRDLKPGNVLLRVEGAEVVPVVADFGLAKSLLADQRLTASGSTMGTPSYMAPEQFVDAGEVDRRADIWSLGVMLYELLAGVRPFPEDDVLTLMRAISCGAHGDLAAVAPSVPQRLVEAVEGCLEVDPRLRFADVGELLRFIDGAPETAFVELAEAVDPAAPEASTRRTVSISLEALAELERPAIPRLQAQDLLPPDDRSLPWFGVGAAVFLGLGGAGLVLLVLMALAWLAAA